MSEEYEIFPKTLLEWFSKLSNEQKIQMSKSICITMDSNKTKLYLARVLLSLAEQEEVTNYAITYDISTIAYDKLVIQNKNVNLKISPYYENINENDILSIPVVAKKLATTYLHYLEEFLVYKKFIQCVILKMLIFLNLYHIKFG